MATSIITDYSGQSYTNLGTRIVKPGEEMDKNAFLQILAAELSNQDPTQDVDSTQYVSQLAQFASMEQMQNLNNTMTDSANRSLVGKGVTVQDTDANGNKYTGIVKAVTSVNGKGYISMVVNENGQNVYKDFLIDNVESVVEVADSTESNTININGNVQYMFASSLIGKDVKFTELDDEGNEKDPETGTVVGAYKENGLVYVKIQTQEGETKSVTYDRINSVGKVD